MTDLSIAALVVLLLVAAARTVWRVGDIRREQAEKEGEP